MLGRGLLAFVSATVLSTLAAGCSSGDGSSSSSTSPDGGSATLTEGDQQGGDQQEPGYVTIQVLGSGMALSQNAEPTADGGLTGSVVCSAGSPASECTTAVGTMIFAYAAPGWRFSGFTEAGFAPGTNLSGSASYRVTASSPSTVQVVFVQVASPDAG